MRCLIIGGGGFIGTYLAPGLLNHGYEVKLLDKSFARLNHFHSQIEYIVGDLFDQDVLSHALIECDIVIHLGSSTFPKNSNENPLFDIESNLKYTVSLLQMLDKKNISKFIFLSSGGAVYGVPQYFPVDEDHPTNPMSSYGIVKLAIEKYLSLYSCLFQFDYRILRLSNVYGKGQDTSRNHGAVSIFYERNLNNKEINVWGDGSAIRDYIHVIDVVEAIIKAIDYSGLNHTFNIGSGQGHSLNDVISLIETANGKKMIKKNFPKIDLDVPKIVLDISRAKLDLAWYPKIPLSEGITMYQIENM